MVCLPKLRPIKYIKHFYHLQSFKVLLLTYSHTMCIVCRRVLFFSSSSSLVPSDPNVFSAFVVHNLIHDLQLHTHKQANDSISQWQIFQHYYCVLICRLLKLVYAWFSCIFSHLHYLMADKFCWLFAKQLSELIW